MEVVTQDLPEWHALCRTNVSKFCKDMHGLYSSTVAVYQYYKNSSLCSFTYKLANCDGFINFGTVIAAIPCMLLVHYQDYSDI